ncbi:MAG: hypothetical protein F4Z15_10180 [Gammaproteobacteria bacterium]|nr:hypothetical protein [Gammaproteobacteria bacterium]
MKSCALGECQLDTPDQQGQDRNERMRRNNRATQPQGIKIHVAFTVWAGAADLPRVGFASWRNGDRAHTQNRHRAGPYS